MRYPPFIDADDPLPPFHRVRMHPPRRPPMDIPAAIRAAMDSALPAAGVRPGDRVAVAVGSRGIRCLPVMVKSICARLSEAGAYPFIMPAMGSHGGASDEGQRRVLERLGVTEDACGAPIVSSLAAEQVATVMGDAPVYYARDALMADHAICLNRVKPHTKFKAPVESGIHKMLVVGMGKHEGALAYHRHALRHGFFPLLKEMGSALLGRTNFRFGIAVVEDERDETLHVEALGPDNLLEREQALLAMAAAHLPRLPLGEADVLVVGRIGKEISGAGMDPNITGRAYDLMEDDFSGLFSATRVVILNLSETGGGNAIGLGNADIITEKVYRSMDYEATVINALTSVSLRKAFIPIRLPDDRRAIRAAFATLGPMDPADVRAVIIRDTRHLSEFWVSAALGKAVAAAPGAEVEAAAPLQFNENGEILINVLTDEQIAQAIELNIDEARSLRQEVSNGAELLFPR